MVSRNDTSHRRGGRGVSVTQFVFGMLTVVGCAVLLDQVVVPAFKQPVKLAAPQAGAAPGAFARSSDAGDGVTFPIGKPNLLSTYETAPDVDGVHTIEGTNAQIAAATQPQKEKAVHVEPPARGNQQASSDRWFVDSERPYMLPPEGGYFSAPVGGFRGFPGGIGSGSVKGQGAVGRNNS